MQESRTYPRVTFGSLKKVFQHGDRPYNIVLIVSVFLTIGLVIGIGYELWRNSALSRQAFGLSFLYTSEWDPALTNKFGALPFILGTLITSLIAVLVAVPLGLGTAIFLAELAPDWLRQPLSFLAELLAAVPSVIYGLWGLFVFIPIIVKPFSLLINKTLGFLPLFKGPVFGPSRLAAGLLLAIMVFPTITAISRDVLKAIPNSQREAAMALGATRWEMISQILIPYGTSGLLGAIILGLGRALGETIAVTMVIGNNLDLTASLLHPGYTMASLIANEFTEATTNLYLNALVEVGLILFFITLVLNLLARLLIWRVSLRTRTEARV